MPRSPAARHATPIASAARSGERPQRVPWRLLATVAALIGFGLVCIASASLRPVTDGQFADDGYHWRQLQWLAVALVLAVPAVVVPYWRIARCAWLLYAAGLGLLVAVLLVGNTVNGAKRWLGAGGLAIQPSEFAKVLMILVLAQYLRWWKGNRTFLGLLPPGLLVAVPMLLILRQPDLGTTLVFVPIWFAMMFVAGAKKRHLAVLVVAGLLIATAGYHSLLKPYQQARLTAFLDPEACYETDGYHLVNSRTAIANGGLLGNGPFSGSQNLLGYLPENHTDFIFGVVGEEWGLLGTLGLIGLYCVLLLQLLTVAYETREPFGRLLCVGVATMIAFQVMVNVGMTIGLMPITGLTLPFVSYGGSSLIAMVLAIALVVNVRMRQVVVI